MLICTTWCYVYLPDQGNLDGFAFIGNLPYPCGDTQFSGTVSFYTGATDFSNVTVETQNAGIYDDTYGQADQLILRGSTASGGTGVLSYGGSGSYPVVGDGFTIICSCTYLTDDTDWQPINGATIDD